MALPTSIVIHLKRSGKYYLYIVAGLLLFIWGLETPPGILGKADAVGYAFCHRIDFRSFHIGLRQLPLCARCTGQYVGAMIGLLFQAVVSPRRSGFPPKRVLVILGVLGLAYAIDGLNSYLYLPPILSAFPGLPHLYVPSNTLRLLTGSGIGLAIAVILYPAFVGSIFSEPDSHPAMWGTRPLLVLLGILYPTALISALGVIILLTFAYTIVILRIFKRVNTYTRFSQISVPLVAGFVVTIAQIALFDLVRFTLTGTWAGFTF
jgi:uncharacterized membrane protein